MFKSNKSKTQLKEPTIFEIPASAKFEDRQAILRRLLNNSPKLTVQCGDSTTNPYKIHYDIIQADRRSALEKYKKSILWSPHFTPTKFKIFIYPFIAYIGFLVYLRYIVWPRNMMRYKEKGFNFPELEAKGWLNDWIPEEYDNPEEAEIFQDWTLTDIQGFEKEIGRDKKTQKARIIHPPYTVQIRKKTEKALDEIYKMRKDLNLN